MGSDLARTPDLATSSIGTIGAAAGRDALLTGVLAGAADTSCPDWLIAATARFLARARGSDVAQALPAERVERSKVRARERRVSPRINQDVSKAKRRASSAPSAAREWKDAN